MERAERMVLLAVGLAFDILVPVLWLMVVLMAITAIHRFVKVWSQASGTREHPSEPMRLRLRRHSRPTGGDEVGVGAPPTRRIAEWWAARGSRTGEARRRSTPRASRRRTRP
jgi:hypothetical protein